MNLTEKQRQKVLELANRSYPQFSKRTVWVIRVVMITLFALWIAGGLYLNNQVKQDEARMEQARLEAQRKEERLRRTAQYQQAVQERSRKPQSRNALDNL